MTAVVEVPIIQTIVRGQGGPAGLTGAAGATTGWVVIAKAACADTTGFPATCDINSGIDATYDVYHLFLKNFVPATTSGILSLRVSEDAGATFKSGSGNYNVGADTTQFNISAPGLNGATTAGVCGRIEFHAPSRTDRRKIFTWHNATEFAATAISNSTSSGLYKLSVNPINALRLYFANGNIASGNWVLMGLKEG